MKKGTYLSIFVRGLYYFRARQIVPADGGTLSIDLLVAAVGCLSR